MPLSRATFSIDQVTLERFNRSFPSGARSRIVQQLIERELDERDRRLLAAATAVETDPAFATVHEDASLWIAATSEDGFSAQ
ncbi:MAG: hypothetical protein ACRC7G_11940 [Beijerinckiaceae bacterium]